MTGTASTGTRGQDRERGAELLRRVLVASLPTGLGETQASPGSADWPMHRVEERPLEDAAWQRLFAEADRTRCLGFLQAAIDADALPVTAQQREQAVDRHAQWCTSMLRLERSLLEAAAFLEDRGIDLVVLKGTAHAHLIYPDPSWRSFGDNDLLLRTKQFDDAVAALAELGYHRPVPQVRPGFDARFGKGATLLRPGNEELDLHRTLLFGTFGLQIDLDELFASSVSFKLGGRTLQALGPETRLLHLCYHAALGDPEPRPASVRDLAQQLALADHEDERVVALVDRWQAHPVVARAFQLVEHVLGVAVTGAIRRHVEARPPTRRERRAVASYVGDHRRFAHKVIATLPYVQGPRAKIALLRAVAVPDRELAAAFDARGPSSWIRRGLGALTGRRRP